MALFMFALAACTANHNSIYRLRNLDENPTIITLDAKQRSILSEYRLVDQNGKPDTRSVRAFCAEPSPDVFSVIAQSLSAGGSFGKSANPASIQAALNMAYGSAEQGSTIPRTQTVNMLRELMFRTCERYLSGGYDTTELSLQAIRDQRLMVSILAIEQLTGAVTPKPVVIAATGTGGAGASGEAIVRLDDARQARDKASADLESATTSYEQVNGTDKICDAIRSKKEDELTDDQKTKVKSCSDVGTKRDKATSASAASMATYQELSNLARNGGVTVATDVSSSAAGGLDQAKAVENVSWAVQAIVTQNFSDSTETMMFCLRVLRDQPDRSRGETALVITAGQKEDLKSVCVKYLDAGVSAAEERLRSEIAVSKATRTEAVQTNFQAFWTDQRKADLMSPPGRTAFVAWLRSKVAKRSLADCFGSATDEQSFGQCFDKLPLPAQRAAIAH